MKSVSEIPDFRSDDEIAAWYQTHSTALIQDQVESVPAQVGGQLRSRLVARRKKGSQAIFGSGRKVRKLVDHPHPSKG